MGLFRWLFGRKEKNAEQEKEEIEEIRQIEEEAERLEKQWEEKVKEFGLYEWQEWYGGFGSPPKKWHIYNPYTPELWRRFIKLNKKIRALDVLINYQESLENKVKTKKEIETIRKFRKIIGYKEKNVISKLNKQIKDFENAIQKSEKKEDDIVTMAMLGYYSPEYGYENRKYTKWEKLPEEEKQRLFTRHNLAFKDYEGGNPHGWDYKKRHNYFKHLIELCEELRQKLKEIAPRV